MAGIDAYSQPTTLLQAMNLLLETIGQRAVNSLDTPGVDGETALKRLGETSVEVQSEGWWFNTEDEYPIDPTPGGEIVLPSGTLEVRQIYTPDTYLKRLVVRGGKLYDRRGHTFNVGVPVKIDCVLALQFEELPQAARWYITVRAARRFASGKLVSGTVYQFTKADEGEARLRLEQAEDNAQHMDPLDTTNPHIQFMRQR